MRDLIATTSEFLETGRRTGSARVRIGSTNSLELTADVAQLV
ncbi:MAG: hypothetical protein WAN22_07785 [Solirubrobacteraceae bacterium]